MGLQRAGKRTVLSRRRTDRWPFCPMTSAACSREAQRSASDNLSTKCSCLLAIEFAHNLGREGATPIGSMPAAKWGVLWPHGLDQVRIIQDLPEPPYHLAISLRLIRNHSSTARSVKGRSMSLLRCNADCTAGERTNFRNRTTFMASVRSYLCHSNRCAALIASAITRSEFMRHEMHAELWRATPRSQDEASGPACTEQYARGIRSPAR